MTDHREQNSSFPRHRQEIPRDFLTEWEATSLKPTEDAKMKNDEAERLADSLGQLGAILTVHHREYNSAPILESSARAMSEAAALIRTQAARIAELETKLQAVLRREEDANRAAFAHMRRITALEADGIAARKATAKNYARAEAAEVTADDLRAENERLRDAAGDLTKAMRLFWEADEAADEAKREGMACDAARYEKMATGRWQRIPCLIDALEAALQPKQEDV